MTLVLSNGPLRAGRLLRYPGSADSPWREGQVRARLIAMAAILWCLAGCSISRDIIEVAPPSQPRLGQLEQHLDYADPDEGRPDYIFVAD